MTIKQTFDLEKLAARAEIQHVMNLWCRAIDRRDWGLAREVFHPDAHDDHGIFRGDVDGLIAWGKQRHSTIDRSMHFATNMTIEFADDDNAIAETYSLAIQRYPSEGGETRKAIAGGADIGDNPFDMVISGRYVDHFQRRDGEWKIFRRTVVFDNSMLFPVPSSGGAQINPDWETSHRDGSDFIWRLREKMGISGSFGG